MDMKMFDKLCSGPFKFLQNKTFLFVLTIILVLLTSTLFPNINYYVKNFTSNKIVRLLLILFIVCLASHSPCVAVLFAIFYVMTICSGMEMFESKEEKKEVKEQEAVHKIATSGLTGLQKEMGEGENKTMKKDSEVTEINQNLQQRFLDTIQDLSQQIAPVMNPTHKYEGFENETDGDEDEDGETKETFITQFLSNNDFEKYQMGSMRNSGRHNNCLSTNPNHFELVGDGCSPVQTFQGELNAQGMNDITGFDMAHSFDAHPVM
jgi:hypothetical protein